VNKIDHFFLNLLNRCIEDAVAEEQHHILFSLASEANIICEIAENELIGCTEHGKKAIREKHKIFIREILAEKPISFTPTHH